MADLTQLRRQICGGRRVAHALALCGPAEDSLRLAWDLAKTWACDGISPPCGQCGPCLRVEKRQSEAVLFIEPDKGSIKLEAVERIAPFLSLQRLTRARVILMQEAQSLNAQATNSILKLVEEPPPHTHFLFLAPEAGQLLPTLRSRLQIVRLPAAPRRPVDGASSAMTFLSGCLLGRSGAVKSLMENIEGRESAEQAARVMQHLLRDWAVLGSGQEIHQEAVPELERWPQWNIPARVELWQRARQLEADLRQNVDRNLAFENFYLQARHAVD